ncbi:MAG TPA: 6-phosphogluconolactonase [Vitreimonas sp.]|uniref:6-phosphogluconolactonase n=1 Tax=Vitreimonas sp. TaxID=3069702 RepID=UPI002D34563C|nr:6-phosphogluconolactonase [Vitreimonas sp.]HYD87746.1 6-phosphogluconolactonase [Vitreimonas sp.]
MENFSAFADRPALMQAAAERMARAANDAIAARGSACLALSGGSTPEPAYRALAAMKLDWLKITLALVDERFVPPSDNASNEKLVQRAFEPVFAQGAQFKPMFFATSTVAQAADCAETLYAPLHIDFALMGMGDDGHTASWFPGATARPLDPTTRRTVIDVHAPQAAGSPDRLTLTGGAYGRITSALLLIAGRDKRQRLERAARQPVDQAPVAALFAPGAPKLEIFWAP